MLELFKIYYNKDALISWGVILWIAGGLSYANDLKSDILDEINRKKSFVEINEILPDIELVCLHKEFKECLNFDFPRTARVEASLNSSTNKKSYTVDVTPIDRR